MTDHRDTIDSPHVDDENQLNVAQRFPSRQWADHDCVDNDQTMPTGRQTEMNNDTDSIEMIVCDVEAFTRQWISRIRGLIRRSSVLVERESLLVSAISRLDHQKSDWTQRIASKEEGIREQSKRLTEAWLSVETERRKAIQGVPPGIPAATQPNRTAVVADPAQSQASDAQPPQPTRQQTIAAQPVTAINPGMPQPMPAPVGVQTQPRLQDQIQVRNIPIQNTPISAGRSASRDLASVSNAPISTDPNCVDLPQDEDANEFQAAEAATRQKIEEFKRMQRAIRSNRNK